jgi:hypothetical protein
VSACQAEKENFFRNSKGEPMASQAGISMGLSCTTQSLTALHLVLTVVQAYAEYAKKKSAINDFIMRAPSEFLPIFVTPLVGEFIKDTAAVLHKPDTEDVLLPSQVHVPQ